MKLVFFCNYLNHHQVLLADEFHKLLGDDYCFVATMPTNPSLLKGGMDYSVERVYCLRAEDNFENKQQSLRLAKEAEVACFGGDALEYEIERSKYGGLSFEVSERWLKKGFINLLSPRLLKWQWHYHTRFRKFPFYKLCSGAYAAKDDTLMRTYIGRHYKWGYFTKVEEPGVYVEENAHRDTRIMWCGRFIDWKHPELAIECAQLLKLGGYDFRLEMYGDGNLKEKMEQMSTQFGLQDVVTFHGNQSNEQILSAMRAADIFLMTSDHQEGWGAVANEAMANGCCLVGSNEAGSIPYLLRDGENGFIFKSGSVEELYSKVKYLLDNPSECLRMSTQGQQDMRNIWNAQNAAQSFLKLINGLKLGLDTSIEYGPCSKA